MGVFDDPKLLDAWKRTGAFPAIHRAMFHFVFENIMGKDVLDLCCAFGLLGEQLARALAHHDFDVCGLDGNLKSIEAGRAAGISIPLFYAKIDAFNLYKLRAVIVKQNVTAVIARRCLPEVLGDSMALAPEFTATLADAGVREIFLEGRTGADRSKHPLSSVEKEIEILAPQYKAVKQCGPLAYLRRHDAAI